ncbi:aminotransferase class I/II-fold pyridoxal phosphate-dependent enzyme [Asticcacaulis sp. ZE23SCel15]|uniref:aminotransferase class I/II-fold pyridoxal phosphate-dependent enzyme n=1 Tax=Asticcacaulis sp. ZE23SCel15 TaxID=3059027 RepID=UPI00265FF13C|nr:aminotransferase class I/II-fold pyridoxal phosphate-dependent enzyme [Asticcacaulis sp. ZE23SCel15]WKL58740.1 aminotransferase class I/II-fold pyridoxal phosphate-dependent enzyme [Asticcacaulis sp. ZE23SCel15]
MADDIHGPSRRAVATILALGASAAQFVRPALAQPVTVRADVRIDANEHPEGPIAQAVTAATAALSKSNRYAPGTEREDLITTIAAIDGVAPDMVVPWPGSSDPLYRLVRAYSSATRGLVVAAPVFEMAAGIAADAGYKVTHVPVRPSDLAHDVKAMLAADPDAGLYYICNPNNPVGTLTPLADIEWLAANIKSDAILLIDEAYIDYTPTQKSTALLAKHPNVVILRTFSKVYGMAGMRMGYTLARPDLIKPLMDWGSPSPYMLPVPAIAAATASLKNYGEITKRVEEITITRDWTIARLNALGYKSTKGLCNCFMVDWRTPAKPVQQAILAKGVAIGRNWPVWPTQSRITVGTPADMKAFIAAVEAVNPSS